MTLRQLSVRIEISFWRVTIDLLSDSSLIQGFIGRSSDGFSRLARFGRSFDPLRGARWAAMGLGTGFFIGLLVSLILY